MINIEKINALNEEIISLLEKSDCNFAEVSQSLSSVLTFLCMSSTDTKNGRKIIYEKIMTNIESSFNELNNQ